MASSDPWWVLAESTGQFTYFQATDADAHKRASLAIQYNGQQNLYGPYNSKADAETAVSSGTAKPQNAGAPALPTPFSDVAHALSAFYDVLTNGKMWRSLGWLLLGVLLMITGIGLLIGPAAARRSPLGVAAGFARRAYG